MKKYRVSSHQVVNLQQFSFTFNIQSCSLILSWFEARIYFKKNYKNCTKVIKLFHTQRQYKIFKKYCIYTIFCLALLVTSLYFNYNAKFFEMLTLLHAFSFENSFERTKRTNDRNNQHWYSTASSVQQLRLKPLHDMLL